MTRDGFDPAEKINQANIIRFKQAGEKDRPEILAKVVDINYALPSEIFDSYPLEKENSSIIEAGYTLLHFAAHRADLQSVKFLLDHNADFMKQGAYNGYTPFHHAALSYGYFLLATRHDLIRNEDRRQIANMLLSAQVKSGNTCNPRDMDGISHLHLACAMNDVEAVEFFLNSGERINQTVDGNSKNSGSTCLHFAVRTYAFETVELLLTRGADLNKQDAQGMSALHLLIDRYMTVTDAMTVGRPFECLHLKNEVKNVNKMIELILRHREWNNPYFVDERGLTPLHVAATMKDVHTVENLLKIIPNINAAVNVESSLWPGYTALHFAARFNIETMKLLLKNGANIFAENSASLGPLAFCLTRYKPMEMHPLLSEVIECRDIILSDGSTKLLDVIAAMQDLNSLNDFLENWTDVNSFIPSDSLLWPGCTLLHFAVAMARNRSYILEKLQRTIGYDPNSVFDEENAESFNCSEEHMLTYLELIKLCMEKGCNATIPDADGSTPIHIAFELCDDEALDILLRSNRDSTETTNHTNLDNLSLLHIACVLNDRLMVEQLLSNRADVNISTEKKIKYLRKLNECSDKIEFVGVRANSTPLHLAVIFENEEIVELLVANGADVYAKDAMGFTPLHVSMASFEKLKGIACRLLSTDNLKESRTDLGFSHLHVAAYANDTYAIMKLLRCEGVDVNSMINFDVLVEDVNWHSLHLETEYSVLARFTGLTPLHVAMCMLSIDAAIALLFEGEASFHAKDITGISPFYYAVNTSKHFKTQAYMLKHFAEIIKSQDLYVGPIDDSGLTMLHVACAVLDKGWARDLLTMGADVNAQIGKIDCNPWSECTPLQVLMFQNRRGKDFDPFMFMSTVWLMLAHKADVTVTPILADFYYMITKKGENQNMIQEAADLLLKSQKSYAINPSSSLGSHFHYACARNVVHVVAKFLENGVDVNFIPRNPFFPSFFTQGSYSPLHSAAKYGSIEVARLLVEHGADVMIRDKDGSTPLHYAIHGEDGADLKFIEVLLSARADINARDQSYQTPWDLLLNTGKIKIEEVEFFIQNGAKIHFVDYFLFNGILGLALHMEQEHKQWIFRSVLEILDKSSDCDERNCNIIHSVVLWSERNKEQIPIEFYITLLEKMIAGGCDLNQQNIGGFTPLALAQKCSNISAVSALLKLGADINIAPNNILDRKRLSYTDQDLFGHISKMYIAGMPINRELREMRNVAISRKTFNVSEEYEKRCQMELEWMGNTKISPLLTMRDFLYDSGVNEYHMLSESERSYIDGLFNPHENIFAAFPEYGSLLLCQYRKAVALLQLMESAINA